MQTNEAVNNHERNNKYARYHSLVLSSKHSTWHVVLTPLNPPIAKIMSSIISMAKLLRGLYMSGMRVQAFVVGLYFSPQHIRDIPLNPPITHN